MSRTVRVAEAVTGIGHERARNQLTVALARSPVATEKVWIVPRFGSPFRWYGIVGGPNDVTTADVDLLPTSIRVEAIHPRNGEVPFLDRLLASEDSSAASPEPR